MARRFRSKVLLVASALFAGSLAGCGTIENLAHVEQPTRPYGGVSADFAACREIVSPSQPPPDGYFPGKNLVLPTVKGICCCIRLVDVPVSLVTDTLTLPIAMSQAPPNEESEILGASMGPALTREEMQGQAGTPLRQ